MALSMWCVMVEVVDSWSAAAIRCVMLCPSAKRGVIGLVSRRRACWKRVPLCHPCVVRPAVGEKRAPSRNG